VAKTLYFGHPINVYDTPLERSLLAMIAAVLPEWEVLNPNAPEHNAGYATAAASGNGMRYFLDEVLPGCDGGIFLPFRDGKWGKGVFTEAEALFGRRCPIWMIDHRGLVWSLDGLPDLSQVLTIEETRSRIRGPDRKPLPF
jgi:hypothetical protein